MCPPAAFVAPLPPALSAPSAPSACRPRMQDDASSSPAAPKPLVPLRAPSGELPKSRATWAQDHHPQFDCKGAGSHEDWNLLPGFLTEGVDAGDKTTPAGTEVLTCRACTGTGKTFCSICRGNTFFGPDGPVACNGCAGKVQVTCSTCYGSGKQMDVKGEWWNMDFAKFFRKG